jgi:hypothetical protein
MSDRIEQLYLIPVDGQQIRIHGVDYHKGVPRHGCGVHHPVQTRECRPVLYREKDLTPREMENAIKIEETQFVINDCTPWWLR